MTSYNKDVSTDCDSHWKVLSHFFSLISSQLIVFLFKMATKIEDRIVSEDKLTIFTLKDEAAVREIRKYVIEHWKTLMQHMDGLTVLFIAGIHGSDTGKLLSPDMFSNIQTLKNQVRPKVTRYYWLKYGF